MKAIILFLGSTILKGPLEEEFKKAAEGRNLVEITDKEGHKRTVAPYIIFSTRDNEREFATVYVSGHSDSGAGPSSWRNLKIKDQVSVKILPDKFEIIDTYNPFNERNYYELHYYIKPGKGKTKGRKAPEMG